MTKPTDPDRYAAIAELISLRDLNARLVLEARIHAGEAKTANASLAECYCAVSGATGERGNWHGAQPVVDEITRLRARLRQVCQALVNAVGADGPCSAEDAADKLATELTRLREQVTSLEAQGADLAAVTRKYRAERDTLRAERDALVPLAKWASEALTQEHGDLDGGWVQDSATECGALVIEKRTEPCAEDCTCSEYYDDGDPFDCYRINPAARAVLAKIEAEGK